MEPLGHIEHLREFDAIREWAAHAPFVRQMGLSFAIAADPGRQIYGRYATAYIPRTYVIAPDGKIAFQTAGSGPEDFSQLVTVAKQLLAKTGAK